MIHELHLNNVGPADKLDLELGSRVNLLTGDNGLGKSFLLDVAWWALTRTWTGDLAWPRRRGEPAKISYAVQGKTKRVRHESKFDRKTQEWNIRQARPPMPGLTIYAGVDNSFSVWDPARNYWQGSSKSRENGDRPTAFHFSQNEVWDGLHREGEVLCKGLIDDWVLWQQSREEGRFDRLKRVLSKLSASSEEELVPGQPMRLRLNDVRDLPSLEMPYGTVPLTIASAGIRRIVALAYLMVWAWNEHVEASEILDRETERRLVFLIDEIEAHLHPRWQRAILPALLDVADALTESSDVEIQLIVTTHAPLVLASMEPIFRPEEDALFVFDLIEGEVELEKRSWRPEGDVSGWLTSEVFDLEEPRSREAEEAIRQALDAIDRPDLPLDRLRSIHRELRSVLGDTDPFWIRWRYRATKAGVEP